MPVIGDVLGLHDHFKMRLLLAEGLQRILRVPLERGLRFGHKARSGSRDAHAARTVGRILAPAVGDLLADVGNTVQILIGFRRQTHHEIELDIVPAALKRDFASMQNVFFSDVLIDDIAQALCACLAGKGQAALARFLHALHQLRREAVRTERRQRQADMARLAVVKHALGQTGQLAVIARGKRGQRNLLIAGIFQHRLCLLQKDFLRFGAERTVGVARLTETAAAWAAAEQLDHRSVKDNIGRRNDERLRIIHGIQIFDDALLHHRRSAVRRRYTFDRSVLVVLDLVQRRDVHAFDLCCCNKEILFGPVFTLCLAVQVGKLEHDFLAVADHEQIDKICERLRIVRARSAACYNVFQVGAVLCEYGDSAEIQHVQNVGKRQLILKRERNNIEIRERIAAFETVKRNTGGAHFRLHIDPRRAYALAPDSLLVIEQTVQNTRAKVRHRDLVSIRKAESEPQIYVLFVLHH